MLGSEREGDEDTLLLVASRRDPLAFDQFFVRNWDRVLAYFGRRIFCPTTSSELAAEAFATAYEARSCFEPTAGTGIGWLFGIAGNLHKSWLRSAVVTDRAGRRYRLQTPVLVEEDLERIERLVDLTELQRALEAALGSLSPKVRDAVLLRVALDLPYGEVAASLGCSIGAARVRVSRGLDHLLEHMDRADGGQRSRARNVSGTP